MIYIQEMTRRIQHRQTSTCAASDFFTAYWYTMTTESLVAEEAVKAVPSESSISKI